MKARVTGSKRHYYVLTADGRAFGPYRLKADAVRAARAADKAAQA